MHPLTDSFHYFKVSPCELHCTPKGLFGLYFSKKLADQVHDGTPCAPGRRDVCINGKCEVCTLTGHLHDDVILLLRIGSFRVSLSVQIRTFVI